MLNTIILKEKRAAGENFVGFQYENHLKTLQIDIFYAVLGGPNDTLSPHFLGMAPCSPPLATPMPSLT